MKMSNMLFAWLRQGFVNTLRLGSEPEHQTQRHPSSEYSKSLLSKALFTWAFRIIRIANFRVLSIEDFELINPNRTVVAKHALFTKAWASYTLKPETKLPLLWALLSAYRAQWLPAVAMCTVSLGGKLASVVVYKLLLEFLVQSKERDLSSPGWGWGVVLIVALGAAMFICAIIRIHYMTSLSLTGGEIKTFLGNLMFEKSLVISPLARRSRMISKEWSRRDNENSMDTRWTQGAIIHSMNSNTERIETSINSVSHLIGLISTIPMTLGLGWWLLDWAGVVGMLVGFGMLPLVCFCLSPLSKLRRRINAMTEERVDLVNDIVGAVRLIKYCAWEHVFASRFNALREREVSANSRFVGASLLVRVVLGSLASNSPNLVATAIYTHFHHGNATIIIVPYFYLSILFRRFAHRVPVAIIDAINAYNALLDVQDFLQAEEAAPGKDFIIDPNLPYALKLDKATFIWDKDRNEGLQNQNSDDLETQPLLGGVEAKGEHASFALNDLDLQVGVDELVAVVGHVGSGKSSLAAGLSGNMVFAAGQISMRSRPSYFSQTPWIQNGTIRENIVFGRDFEPDLYNKIIQACALESDLAAMTDSDRTILGELGVNLSGGQKQRIQLARILYQDRDIVILDDCLSAMDVHTGEHVFQHAITSMMAGKCRLLITHQLHVLARCSRIIWLDDGRIRASGTLDRLRQIPQFQQLLSKCEQQQTQSDGPQQSDKKYYNEKTDSLAQMQLMQDEEVRTGFVNWREYWDLLHVSTPIQYILGAIFFLTVNGVATITFSMSITWWAKGSGFHGLSTTEVGVICCMAISCTWLTSSCNFFIIRTAVLKASSTYSMKALERLLTATVTTFDTTPLGRILNIFTSDLNAIDLQLSEALSEMIFSCLLLTAYLTMTVIILPAISSIFLPWMLTAAWLIYFYSRAPLQVKRLDRTFASFVTSKLTEGIVGRSSITSCEREQDFVRSLQCSIDDLNSVHFTGYACEAWISMAYTVIALVLYLFTGSLVILQRHSLSPGLGLIVLTSAEDLSYFIQEILSELTQVQRGVASVGRVRYYCEQLEQEPPHYRPGFEPPMDWPRDGQVSFQDVFMRYRDGLPLALNAFNLDIKGGEHVGIVGRTGAGKSSVFAALTRSINLAGGNITIDGVDISKIGLHNLRNAIAVIPQDAILFKGTIRSNLTPLGVDLAPITGSKAHEVSADERNISDEVLLNALVKTSLMNPVEYSNTRLKIDHSAIQSSILSQETTLPPSPISERQQLLHLDSPVLSGGSNLSHGERQLLIIARAIVRNSPIILCDEATSAVDPQTDARVQESIRNAFTGKTVISIAHRISTIASFDRVVVLDAGRVVECGPPRELYGQAASLFRAMCLKSNVTYGGSD